MSAYTITIMVKQPGELLPEVIETRNTQYQIERLVGGTIKPIALNYPIYGVVQLGGPAGSAHTTVFAHHDQGYWGGLSVDEQKRIVKWFLAAADKKAEKSKNMTNEKLIAYARSLNSGVFKVRFSGNIVTFGTMKSALRAYGISGSFSKGLRKPPAPLVIEGVGTCWTITYKPIACEGWCTVALDNPIGLGVEVVTIRVEDVMEVVE